VFIPVSFLALSFSIPVLSVEKPFGELMEEPPQVRVDTIIPVVIPVYQEPKNTKQITNSNFTNSKGGGRGLSIGI
jgi:hypothetical protein